MLAWLKYNQELLPALRKQAQKTPRIEGAKARLADVQGYIKMLTRYLRHGDWCSNFYDNSARTRTRWTLVIWFGRGIRWKFWSNRDISHPTNKNLKLRRNGKWWAHDPAVDKCE